MPEQRMVSAREMLGTAFPAERKIEHIEPELIRIDVYFIHENKTREKLDPLEGRADIEDLAALYGPGRFYLIAKRKDDERVISQRTVDVSADMAPEHPLAVSPKPVEPKELHLPEDDDRVSRLEEMVGTLIEKLEEKKPQASSMMDRLLERFLEERLFTPPQQNAANDPSIIVSAVNNALALQTKAIMQDLDIRGERSKMNLEFEARERERRWEREDKALEAKQNLLLETIKNNPVRSPEFDTEGSNTGALLDAITDFLGADKEKSLFGGVTVGSVLEAGLPQITRHLEDRGIFVLTTPQVQQMMASQLEKGRQVGQMEALEQLEGGKPDGSHEGASDAGTKVNPGPDDKAGGPAGGGGELGS